MAAHATSASLSMTEAAREWRRCLRSAEYVLANVEASRWMQVHYEELCGDPDKTLRRIHDFLGTDPARAADKFRETEHHVIGNGMRLDSTSAVALDERWKSVLTEEDLVAFAREAGAVNRRYGYL